MSSRVFSDPEKAVTFLRSLPGAVPPLHYVYIVSTFAPSNGGFGVFVTESMTEAETDIRDKLTGLSFGNAPRQVSIEGILNG